MRAHVLQNYGKSNAVVVLVERPEPPLAPEDVRIEIDAVALNPVDLKTRAGEPKLLLPFAPPFVLGSDLAGTVVEAGHGAVGLRVGDRVFAYAGMDRMGAFAERVVLPASRVAKAPEGVRPEEAACLPLPGLCALAALDAGHVSAGSRVLVHGGGGGVGSLAVQLARHRGAEVFVTVGARDVERARRLGADHAIDYRSERFEERARGMDLVIDTVGGDTLARSWACVTPGGVVASLHVPPPAEALLAAGLRAPWLLRLLLPLVSRGPRAAAAKAGARLAPILTVPSVAGLEVLARAAEGPGLSVAIDGVFPFEELGAAFDRLEGGQVKGRVVLRRA